MLNFLGALSSLLPGYIQGRQQAIADNWQDLQNYNNIQAGQLGNMFTEAAFQPRLDMMTNAARRDHMNTIYSGMNLATNAAMFPGNYYRAMIGSSFAPTQAYQDNWMQILAQQKLMEMAQKGPTALFSGFQQSQQGLNPAPSGIGG